MLDDKIDIGKTNNKSSKNLCQNNFSKILLKTNIKANIKTLSTAKDILVTRKHLLKNLSSGISFLEIIEIFLRILMMTENRSGKNSTSSSANKENTTDTAQKTPAPDKDKSSSFSLVAQYLKDLSYENPNSVEIIQSGHQTPKGSVKIDIRIAQFNTTDFEVILKILLEATMHEKFKCLAEVEYAGLFHLQSVPVEAIEPLLMIEAPRLLFPFARQIVANLSRDGVIPLPQLQPIDFVSLYRERQRQLAATQSAESNSVQ